MSNVTLFNLSSFCRYHIIFLNRIFSYVNGIFLGSISPDFPYIFCVIDMPLCTGLVISYFFAYSKTTKLLMRWLAWGVLLYCFRCFVFICRYRLIESKYFFYYLHVLIFMYLKILCLTNSWMSLSNRFMNIYVYIYMQSIWLFALTIRS